MIIKLTLLNFFLFFSTFGKILEGNKIELRFNENKEFTVLQLTDLHYGESKEQNDGNEMITSKIIEAVKPDLVVVTGDSVSGYAWDGKSKTFFHDNWVQFTRPFIKYKTPYAYTFGNHDPQADMTPIEIGELDKTNPFSLFNGDPEIDSESLSNYTVEIKTSEGEETVALLWLFDTKTTGCHGIEKSWGCINTNQLNWYERESKRINEEHGYSVDGLAFFHIPIVEYLYLWDFGETYGTKHEEVNCPKYNSDVFSSFVKIGNIKGMFVGHDHNNDYGGHYGDIELVYGRKTGYGGYGPVEKRGARVLKLKETKDKEGNPNFSYTHYVITEEGEIVDQGKPEWRGWKDFSLQCAFI